jgi:hypothetical protein
MFRPIVSRCRHSTTTTPEPEAEPAELRTLEDQRCIFFPLFMTGYVIADLLSDNDWFGAVQLVVGSAVFQNGL